MKQIKVMLMSKTEDTQESMPYKAFKAKGYEGVARFYLLNNKAILDDPIVDYGDGDFLHASTIEEKGDVMIKLPDGRIIPPNELVKELKE